MLVSRGNDDDDIVACLTQVNSFLEMFRFCSLVAKSQPFHQTSLFSEITHFSTHE